MLRAPVEPTNEVMSAEGGLKLPLLILPTSSLTSSRKPLAAGQVIVISAICSLLEVPLVSFHWTSLSLSTSALAPDAHAEPGGDTVTVALASADWAPGAEAVAVFRGV